MPQPTTLLATLSYRGGRLFVYDTMHFDASGDSASAARAEFDLRVAELAALGIERTDPREPDAWVERVRGKSVRYFVGYREFVPVQYRAHRSSDRP